MKYEIIIHDPAGYFFKDQPINKWILTEGIVWDWDYMRPEDVWRLTFETEEDKVKFILRWL